MFDRNAICDECGHSYSWHVREMAARRLGGDAGAERVCYRPIGHQSCPCPRFRAGSARSAESVSTGGRLFRNAVLTLLLLVMGLGLLYAYRSQTPAIQTVAISEAIADVNSGRVRMVTIAGNHATLDLTDGTRVQTNLPESGVNPLSDAVTAYNSANPTHPVTLIYQNPDPGFSVIGSILLSLLPVLLIGGFFYYLMQQARSRRDD